MHRVSLDIINNTVVFWEMEEYIPVDVTDEQYETLQDWTYAEAVELIREIKKETIWTIIELQDY
jgi:hypothetical protein